MSSIVFICNLALTNIAKPNISDINEASQEARACRQFYDHVRDALLQSYPWRFAGKTEVLAQIANDKAERWLYAYQRPTDCLKVRRITSELMLDRISDEEGGLAGGHPYAIEGQNIYVSLSPAYLEYTFTLDDPTRYPPMFVEAFGWQLATRLAMPLTRDPNVQKRCFDLAQAYTASASMADANEVREVAQAYGLKEAAV